MVPTTPLIKKLAGAPLITLALVLVISSFLWQASLYQKMLDQVDAELRLSARTLDYLFQRQPAGHPDLDNFCTTASDLLEFSAPTRLSGLFTATGDPLCPATPQHDNLRSSFENLSANDQLFYFAPIDGTTHRLLLFPLTAIDGAAAYLILGTDFSPYSLNLLRWRLMLLLGCILILAGTGLYLRHPNRQSSETLAKLTELMEQSGPDQRPLFFSDENVRSADMRQLVVSYNHMTERMHSGLHRARQFAAHVAHELRTPLTILRGETEIALRSSRTPDHIHKVLESNLEEITRMSYLVDDLLTLSKSDLGEIPLQPNSIRPAELLSDLQRQAQILAGEKDITVGLDCADSDSVIHADELRLRQALLNLLSNAIRYTPVGGFVNIHVKTTQTDVTITISDNGIGIDEKHLQHIFERFYRVDKKNHQYDGGTGLGLAIVKWVVDAHQGTIEVSSSPQHGSHFAVTLPKNLNNH
ncbi:MAG: ATP-binding protein [Pelovirga sp.]